MDSLDQTDIKACNLRVVRFLRKSTDFHGEKLSLDFASLRSHLEKTM